MHLVVQEEELNTNTKKGNPHHPFLKNVHNITDLVTNHISITDFLICDKEDIQEQIYLNKQKIKSQ